MRILTKAAKRPHHSYFNKTSARYLVPYGRVINCKKRFRIENMILSPTKKIAHMDDPHTKQQCSKLNMNFTMEFVMKA